MDTTGQDIQIHTAAETDFRVWILAKVAMRRLSVCRKTISRHINRGLLRSRRVRTVGLSYEIRVHTDDVTAIKNGATKAVS